MAAKAAINTVSEELSPVMLANIEELTYYFVFSAGTSAGAIQAETSHRSAIVAPVFTGTWSPEGSPIVFGDNVVKHLMISGITNWRRARISTGLTGGTLDIYVMGR